MRIVTALLVLVALAGCSSPVGPEIPDGAVPFDPPAVYATWWDEIMHQASIQRDVSRVRWFLVETGPWESARYGGATHGAWVPDGRIYLADGWEEWENLVKHEMLHELLRGDAAHAHPAFDLYPLEVCNHPYPSLCA